MNIRELNEQFRQFDEKLFSTDKVIGTIIQDKDGYNITDEHGNKMLIKSIPSLKSLLRQLSDNM